jgi:hypothetical protein
MRHLFAVICGVCLHARPQQTITERFCLRFAGMHFVAVRGMQPATEAFHPDGSGGGCPK